MVRISTACITAIRLSLTLLFAQPTATLRKTARRRHVAHFPSVDGLIDTLRANDYSNYNALQVHLEKRVSHGLQFGASYTYAHALDDASSASLGSLNNGDFRNELFPQLEYGNADFDVRQRFVIDYAYELPFGHGKKVRRKPPAVL